MSSIDTNRRLRLGLIFAPFMFSSGWSFLIYKMKLSFLGVIGMAMLGIWIMVFSVMCFVIYHMLKYKASATHDGENQHE